MAARFRYSGQFSFDAPTPLKSARLTLRAPTQADGKALFDRFTTDPDVVRYLPFGLHAHIDETRALIGQWLSHRESRTSFAFVIELNATGETIGVIELHPNSHCAAFDCNIMKAFHGHKYGGEACKVISEWVLTMPGIWRAECLCTVGNIAPARGLEYAGLTFEGIARRSALFPNHSPEPVDVKVFSKVRS